MESGIVVLTNFGKKEKQVERLGGQFPRGAYLTPATFRALKEGIESGEIVKRIERYNEKYKNAVKDLEVAEAKAAEIEVAKSAEQAPKVVEQPKKSIDIDAYKAKIAQLNIRIQRLTGNFGTIGNNFGVNVIPNSPARPLKIPRVNFDTLCVLRNIDFSDVSTGQQTTTASEATKQPVNAPAETKPVEKVASWRQLFSEVIEQANDEAKVKIEKRRDNDDSFEEVTTAGEVTETELKRRTLIGQTGEELAKIRDLRKNLNEYDSPFGLGLIEREQNLLDILVKTADISDDKEIKPMEIEPIGEETEFQKIVNTAVGYVEPLTAEEEKEREKEMNDYYSDPETLADIDKQLMKDRLYMMNNPEMAMKIDEAEREADKRVAQKAIEASSKMMNSYELQQGALIQAEELIEIKRTYEGAKKQALELFEKDLVVNGAKKQAKELFEKKKLLEGSMNQAEEIIDRYLAVMGAKAQAKSLYEKDIIKNGAKEQARQLLEKKLIVDGAKEQARQICEKELIIEGAKDQARAIQSKEKTLKAEKTKTEESTRAIASGAKEQALELIEKEQVIRGAKKQAAELAERKAIIDGAKAQAKAILQEENKQKSAKTLKNELLEGAKAQAKEIVEKEKIVRGAKKQAEELNEKSKVIRGAKKQAKELVEKNKILKGARKQAEELNERTIAIRGAKKQAKELIEKGEMLNGAKIQAEELFDRDVAIQGAKKQAKELAKGNTLLNGAKEQAMILLNGLKNFGKTSRNDLDPKMLKKIVIENINNDVDKREIVFGAREQASKLYEKLNKKNAVNKRLEGLDCKFTELNERYGDVVGTPRPLKINKAQYQNLSNFSNMQSSPRQRKRIAEETDESVVIPNVEFLKVA